MFELDYFEITGRMIAAVIFGSIIGYERETRGHNAGLRTHILVAVGSALIALIQTQATYTTIKMALVNPELLQILNTDITRMTAQIVSGIGFLGAGTIIVTKRSVTGLTTAASIWAVAGLGVAVGMGYYFIAVTGCIIILATLRLIKRFFRIEDLKKIEIYYHHREETRKEIKTYFDEKDIQLVDLEYSVDLKEPSSPLYLNLYTISLPEKIDSTTVVEDLSNLDNIIRVHTIKDR